MTEEEHKLLKENNEMLRFIINYICSQQYNSSAIDMKDFTMNVIANMISNGRRI